MWRAVGEGVSSLGWLVEKEVPNQQKSYSAVDAPRPNLRFQTTAVRFVLDLYGLGSKQKSTEFNQ